MVDRTAQAIVLWAVAMFTASSSACSSDAPISDLATRIPNSGFVLLWHIRTEDCLACSLPDYSVRRLQATKGEQFQLVIIHVGRETDESVPIGFLRQRRITPANIITMSAREHEIRYPTIQLPALTLLEDAAVLWSSGDSLQEEERSISLHERIDALIAKPIPE